MFAKAADYERDLLLRDLGILAVRPEALRVELLERLLREIEPALAGKACSVTFMTAICRNRVSTRDLSRLN